MKLSNNWDDYELLSRVASCLKGVDSSAHLADESTSNYRSWRNLLQEFKWLCPYKFDYANMFYDVMINNSDKCATPMLGEP